MSKFLIYFSITEYYIEKMSFVVANNFHFVVIATRFPIRKNVPKTGVGGSLKIV